MPESRGIEDTLWEIQTEPGRSTKSSRHAYTLKIPNRAKRVFKSMEVKPDVRDSLRVIKDEKVLRDT